VKANYSIYLLTVAFLAQGMLSGCSNLSPGDSSQAATTDSRALINDVVTDEGRATQMIALVDQLERNLKANDARRIAHEDALVKINADYTVSREVMQAEYDDWNTDTRAILMEIMETHLAMKDLATPEEWAVISKTKHRIGGF
jgi:hypothetical protein